MVNSSSKMPFDRELVVGHGFHERSYIATIRVLSIMEDGHLLPPGGLEETMLLPLWARAIVGDALPDFNDPEAATIIPRTGYDFSKFEATINEYHKLVFVARAWHYDAALRRYLERHPKATVLNLGAGLDTTFSRVDNGTLRWYDLDLPEGVRYRKRLIPETPRSTCIPRSVFDHRWFDEIEVSIDHGIFLLAGGLFVYHKPEAVIPLFRALAERFPEGEIIFDTVSRMGVRLGNRKMKRLGTTGPFWYFSLGNAHRQIPKWSASIRLVDWFPIWKGLTRPSNCSRKTRLMMRINDLFSIETIVHLRFR